MRKQRYPLTRQAEMLLAYAEATNPKFHELLGHAIDADRLMNEDAQLLVSAAQEIARNNAQPCASSVACIQQLRLRVNQGKLTMESLQLAADLLDAVEDVGGVTDFDGLISTVAPAIRKVAHMTAVEETIQKMASGDEPGEAADRFAAVAQLGAARNAIGATLDWTAAQAKEAVDILTGDRLPTGITELDIALGGGIEKASLAAFLGNPGDGKSLALCHMAATALWDGRDVAYVSTELSEQQVIARIMCNVLNMTTAEIDANPNLVPQRFRKLQANQMVGQFKCVYLTPKVSTISTIRQWLKEQARAGFIPEVLVIDYADRLGAKAAGDSSSYVQQGTVYQHLRDLVIDLGCWGVTASQTTGRQGRKKRLDVEDIADSMEKARICDTLIAIVRHDEDVTGGMVRFRIPKRRNGQAHQDVGPLQMDPERGRMVTLCRSEPW